MTTQPQMFTVAIDRLEPNPWNTNSVSPENEVKLDESVKRFGVFKPIIVREIEGGRLQILGGEHRWGSAQRLGYTEVPVVSLGKISDRKAKEIGLADNGRYGEDDTLGLSGLLRELGVNEVSNFLPYTDSELSTILASGDIGLDDLDADLDKLPDLSDKPAPQATTQVMRFKVPVEDVSWVTALIEREMKGGGFTKEDSLSNAGNAFVSILKQYRDSL